MVFFISVGLNLLREIMRLQINVKLLKMSFYTKPGRPPCCSYSVSWNPLQIFSILCTCMRLELC